MRERFLSETLQLMNEQGLSFTLAQLASQLAVSKRKIYELFASKDELVGAVLDEILRDLKQQVADITAKPNLGYIDKLKALMMASPKALGPLSARAITDIKRQMPDEWLNYEAFFEDRWQRVADILQQGVTAGIFRTVNMKILWKIYRGSINELGDYQFLTQNNSTFHSTMEQTIDILIYGVFADPARREIAY
jgi:AcrR family transcriptional regulator